MIGNFKGVGDFEAKFYFLVDFNPLKVVRYRWDLHKAWMVANTRYLSYQALELLQQCDL